jgi:hypothetical protein
MGAPGGEAYFGLVRELRLSSGLRSFRAILKARFPPN